MSDSPSYPDRRAGKPLAPADLKLPVWGHFTNWPVPPTHELKRRVVPIEAPDGSYVRAVGLEMGPGGTLQVVVEWSEPRAADRRE